MKPNPVGWFEIYVDDLNRAKKFYETVFETELTPIPTDKSDIEMLGFPMAEEVTGCPGALVKFAHVKPGGGGVLIYFTSEDCSVEASRVVDAGGEIHQEKQSIGEYGFVVFATDTEGNSFGIHSMQ